VVAADKSLSEEDVRISALISMVDAVQRGTTTVIDHHASPNFIDGSLDVIASAVEQSGVRAVLCYEVTDRDGLDRARAGSPCRPPGDRGTTACARCRSVTSWGTWGPCCA
jgi:cytosine/adenosine deaminase-related metal-dependent hydrolase